ncbi:MAG: hypothetical protein QNJ89_13940 [Acidimicrobiia bacterium]|nr:hypothetical protein [Acidimicrobiia bacterium]
MADALRDELLSVPGIAGAEVETGEGVAGVRVQLAVGADAGAVGAAVREILIHHGMRPAEEIEEGVLGPPPPPGAPGSVVSFPLVGEHARAETAPSVAEIEPPAPTVESPAEEIEPPVLETESPAPEVARTERLEGVAVEETAAGLSVRLRLNTGADAAVIVQSGLAGLDAAVVQAVGELTGTGPVRLLAVSEQAYNDTPVLTVVLATADRGDIAGAAVQSGGRAYAVARAAWAALKSPV